MLLNQTYNITPNKSQSCTYRRVNRNLQNNEKKKRHAISFSNWNLSELPNLDLSQKEQATKPASLSQVYIKLSTVHCLSSQQPVLLQSLHTENINRWKQCLLKDWSVGNNSIKPTGAGKLKARFLPPLSILSIYLNVNLTFWIFNSISTWWKVQRGEAHGHGIDMLAVMAPVAVNMHGTDMLC